MNDDHDDTLADALAEDRTLNAIFRYKSTSARLPIWVSAEDLAPQSPLPVSSLAALLRQLEMQGFLEIIPHRMYGSSNAAEKQQYGLTREGARRAAYFGTMKDRDTKGQGAVLLALHSSETGGERFATTPADLSGVLHEYEMGEILRVIRILRGQGFIESPASPRGVPEEELYRLTQTGHQVAAYYQREGRFPSPSGEAGSTVNTMNNFGSIGAAVQGDGNKVKATYQAGLDTEAFTEAIQALRDAIQQVIDPDERELGELRLSQLERVISSGQPSESQWERFANWISGTATTVSNGAVLWGLAAAVGQATGHPLPAAPPGLGQ